MRFPRCLLPYLLTFAGILATGSRVTAQHNPYEFYVNDASDSEISPSESVISGTELFYQPLEGSDDIFTRMSSFNFSHTPYSRRGYPPGFHCNYLDGTELSGGLTSASDYSVLSALRYARIQSSEAGLSQAVGNTGIATGTVTIYFPDIPGTPATHSAMFYGTNRTGRFGARLNSRGKLGKKSYYNAMLNRRWGEDAFTKGVFRDEISFLASVGFAISANHRVTVTGTGSSNESGLRSYATHEAFGLTGDEHYNPSWGYFNGKRRNSRVRTAFQPLAAANYTGKVGKTTLNASAGYRFGRRSVSALSWINAMTPYPDYYRHMPSYADNAEAEAIVREPWINGDTNVTQLDWAELYRRNLSTEDDEAYFLEERIESANDLQLGLSARTEIGDRLFLHYGLRMRNENTHYYKRMKDRMGSSPMADLDQYLIDSDIYAPTSRNNVRDNGRLIREGDRFGYDYNIYGKTIAASAGITYNMYRYTIGAGLDVGRSVMQRQGNYEKEIYPGSISYGKSKKLSFDIYSVNVAGRYSFSPQHSLQGNILWMASAPWYGKVFTSPAYVNKIVDGWTTQKTFSANLEYTMTLSKLRMKLSAYYTGTGNESEVYRYYDDIESVYSDMEVTGISKRYMGFELGVSYDFTPRISLSVAAAAGQHKYTSNPDISLLADATLKSYVERAKSYLSGYHTGSGPETVLSAEFRYSSRGWIVSATYNFVGDRYISPNPLRRMQRAYSLADSPERFLEFVRQEKLANSHTLNIFIMKTIRISGNHRITVTASLNNILNDKVIYNGYEQMRISKPAAGTGNRYVPFDSKYSYAYGRTFYTSLTYRF